MLKKFVNNPINNESKKTALANTWIEKKQQFHTGDKSILPIKENVRRITL
jgi:hypothetical protein